MRAATGGIAGPGDRTSDYDIVIHRSTPFAFGNIENTSGLTI